MTLNRKRILGGIGLLIVVAFATGVIRVRCTAADDPPPYGLNPMAERTDETWRMEDGATVQVARTYFTAAKDDVTFHIEWEVPAGQLPTSSSREAMLELARPVLRHAFAHGKMQGIEISSANGDRLPVKRIRAEMRAAGTEQKRELIVSNVDELFVWNWTFDGRPYRIFGPGYYGDTNSGRMTFTMKWHDKALCPSIEGINDDTAFNIAEPVLRRAVAWRLWKVVPVVEPDGISAPRENVDAVGLELGCPEENCVVGTPCKVRGYRVSRDVEMLDAR